MLAFPHVERRAEFLYLSLGPSTYLPPIDPQKPHTGDHNTCQKRYDTVSYRLGLTEEMRTCLDPKLASIVTPQAEPTVMTDAMGDEWVDTIKNLLRAPRLVGDVLILPGFAFAVASNRWPDDWVLAPA